MKVPEIRITEKQLSRWLATALVASSILLGTAVVLAQSLDRGSQTQQAQQAQQTQEGEPVPVVPLPTPHPAAPTAPPAVTPSTEDPPAPRTPSEIAIDQAIAERVRDALATDHLTCSQPIDIAVTRGIANLSGKVSTTAVAQRALSIARDTGGVSAVQDAMKVEEAPAVIDTAR